MSLFSSPACLGMARRSRLRDGSGGYSERSQKQQGEQEELGASPPRREAPRGYDDQRSGEKGCQRRAHARSAATVSVMGAMAALVSSAAGPAIVSSLSINSSATAIPPPGLEAAHVALRFYVRAASRGRA